MEYVCVEREGREREGERARCILKFVLHYLTFNSNIDSSASRLT